MFVGDLEYADAVPYRKVYVFLPSSTCLEKLSLVRPPVQKFVHVCEWAALELQELEQVVRGETGGLGGVGPQEGTAAGTDPAPVDHHRLEWHQRQVVSHCMPLDSG